MDFRTLFGDDKPLLGSVSLLPLPGSRRYAGDLRPVIARAVADAIKLSGAGCDALLVENRHDAPFARDQAGAETIAAMTLLVSAVIESVGVPVGVTVLRNDARAALAVALVSGAVFVRVPLHVGMMVGRDGILEGRATDTIRYRGELGAKVAVFADVHAEPDGAPTELAAAAHEAYYRGLANAVILTGSEPAGPAQLAAVRRALPEAPILLDGDPTPRSLTELLSTADGALTGPWCHTDGRADAPIDSERVKQLVAAARQTALLH